jgi:hypothetical protein
VTRKAPAVDDDDSFSTVSIWSWVTFKTTREHFEGTHDYTKMGTSVVEIVDRSGRSLTPVWNRRWTGIAEGIRTRSTSRRNCLRIFVVACPVRVRFRHYSEYVSYDDYEYNRRSEDFSWIEYVGEPSVRARAFAAVANVMAWVAAR